MFSIVTIRVNALPRDRSFSSLSATNESFSLNAATPILPRTIFNLVQVNASIHVIDEGNIANTKSEPVGTQQHNALLFSAPPALLPVPLPKFHAGEVSGIFK